MSKPKNNLKDDVPENLIKDLLTESELRMVGQRFQIIQLLERSLSIRAVAQRVKVGTDTVLRMSVKLKSSKNLQKYFDQKLDNPSVSKWVFGGVAAEKD